MSTQDETISLLNSLIKIRLAPSKIHGVGVVAMRDISKGTKLYAEIFPKPYLIPMGSMNKLFPEIKEYLLERWPQIVNGSAFMYPTERAQAFMNFSFTPNYDAQNDVTLKDIKKGEEITEDYRLIPGWEIVYPWIKKMENETIKRN